MNDKLNRPSHHKTIDDICDSVRKIRRGITINRCIYGTTGILVVILAVMMVQLTRRQDKLDVLAAHNAQVAIEEKAKREARDDQYIDYIKSMVAVMEKLHKDNPTVLVPKAPELRPSGFPPVTERELERPRNTPAPPHTTPTPQIIKVPGPTKRVYVKPKPWSLSDIFKPAHPTPTPRKKNKR